MSTSSNVQTNAGTTIAIAVAEPATYDEAGFSALGYTNIGEIVNAGTHGPTYALVTHSPLDTRIVDKRKGSMNGGSMELQLGMDIDDAGQAILIDASDVDSAAVDCIHSIEITYQNGRKEWFTALVMSYARNLGTIDQIVGASVTFEVTNKIIDGTAP